MTNLAKSNTSTGEATSYYYLSSRLVALKKGSALEYIRQDHLTGTSMSTDTSGAEKSAISYLPYGETRSGSGVLGTDRKFTGQRLDTTGLYFYNARYYDPSIGRFISADTMVPGFSNPQALNRYSYVGNNPLRYTDPTGNCWGPFAGACHRAKQAAQRAFATATDAAKEVAQSGVEAVNTALVQSGEAAMVQAQAQQALAEEVASTSTDVVVALADLGSETIARERREYLDTPRKTLESQHQFLALSGELVQRMSEATNAIPPDQQTIIVASAAAIPGMGEAVVIAAAVYTGTTIFYPPAAEEIASWMEELVEELDEY